MSLEHFARLSQSIVDAAAIADENKDKYQKNAALVVNSVGVMSGTPKRSARPADLAQATDFIGSALKTAREAKQAKVQDGKKAGTEQPAKSLAELLTETAAEDDE